jgi:hypothetical protein
MHCRPISAPRYLGGDNSPTNIGTMLELTPIAKPTITRPTSSSVSELLSASTTAPAMKNSDDNPIEMRRPTRSASDPPIALPSAAAGNAIETKSVLSLSVSGWFEVNHEQDARNQRRVEAKEQAAQRGEEAHHQHRQRGASIARRRRGAMNQRHIFADVMHLIRTRPIVAFIHTANSSRHHRRHRCQHRSRTRAQNESTGILVTVREPDCIAMRWPCARGSRFSK